MASRRVEFESADVPGRKIAVDADPQTAVTPGDRPGTATITGLNGERFQVVGDYRDIHVKIQAAAAVAHETDPTAG